MSRSAIGVTIGTHALRAVQLRRKGERYVVQRVFSDRLDEETRPVAGRALAARGFKGGVVAGLTGRDVIIRYVQVPPVPDWKLRTLMKYEVAEVGSQSGGEVSADYRKLVLPDPAEDRAEDTVLVSLARNRHLESLARSLESGGLKLDEAVPNSVALFNTFAVNATYGENETALLVNIGGENVDIALQRGGELLFARNATPGARAFTDALVQAFSTTAGKAETLKKTKGDVTPRGQAKYADPTAEKVANALVGTVGQLTSLIQSTLMIARAQTRLSDLRADRVLLGGGGASLKGLDLYLKQAMGVAVERLDPFGLCDLDGLDTDEREQIQRAPHEFAVAVGLAQNRLARESFVLSVLPASRRRQRDFQEKGIWMAGAAAAMGGVLVALWQGRSSAAEAWMTRQQVLSRAVESAEAADTRLRGALEAVQEAQVKHRALAERLAPGALLAGVLSELERNQTDQIYIQQVRLRLDESANTFHYVRPRNASKAASGYQVEPRTWQRSRLPYVTVEGRVSGGENPSRLYEEFVEACQANQLGLLVDTAERYKPGRRGQDGTFTLTFRAAILLRPQEEQGRSVALGDLSVEGEGDEAVFVGRQLDGVLVRVPVREVEEAQRKELLGALPKRTEPSGEE